MSIIQKSSPNFSIGPTTKEVIVLHQTLGLMPGCLNWLTTPVSQVSSHYLITKEGTVYQLVKNEDVAWHAGNIYNPTARGLSILKKDNFGGYINPNQYCIGIEFESLQGEDLTEAQYVSGVELVKSLNIQKIVEHKDLASYKADLTVGVYDKFIQRLNPMVDREAVKKQIIELVKLL